MNAQSLTESSPRYVTAPFLRHTMAHGVPDDRSQTMPGERLAKR